MSISINEVQNPRGQNRETAEPKEIFIQQSNLRQRTVEKALIITERNDWNIYE